MRFSGMLLVVADMEVSRRFYQEVLRQDIMMDLETYVDFGGFCLMTQPQWEEFQDKPLDFHYRNNVCQLAFEEEDLDGFLEHFNSFPGIEILGAVREYEWGQRSFRFYDPDRHIVEVGEDMGAVIKRFLRGGMTVEQAQEKTMFPIEFVRQCFSELGEK